MPKSDYIVELNDVTVIHKFKYRFKNFNWLWKPKETWAVLGPNGSGKSLVANLIVSRILPTKGSVTYGEGIDPKKDLAYVSFSLQKDLIKFDEKNDQTDILDGKIDPGTLCRDIILGVEKPTAEFNKLVKIFKCETILDRGLRFLSTGETRKTLIIRALLKKPKLLILDEPFEGLDRQSRESLHDILGQCIVNECSIMMILNRKEDILKEVSHVLLLKDCSVLLEGNKNEVLESKVFNEIYNPKIEQREKIQINEIKSKMNKNPLISMRNVDVIYGDTVVLKSLNWQVVSGEHWQVKGVNGSGKSTLLSLVSGDNPKAYGQSIELFGIKKGSGESVWDIKKKIGMISSSFQLAYRESITALKVVISGFYDSVGIYKHIGVIETEAAEKWMDNLQISHLAKKDFNDLSYGEQRMILIARTMIKEPPLLLLDEPCQGLDEVYVNEVLNTIDLIAKCSNTTIVYISHLAEHKLMSVTRILELEPGGKYSIHEI